MRYLFLASVLVMGGSAFAQEPDTLDWRGYFPLAVGNEWEYEVRLERPVSPFRSTDSSRTEYLRYRIVGHGVGDVEEGFTLVEERFAEDSALLRRDTFIVRYDAESASVLTADVWSPGTSNERPMPPFAADLDLSGAGDQGQWIWSTARYLDEADVEYWVPTFVRDALPRVVAKSFVNLGGGGAIAVHGFGFVADGFHPDGCSMFCDSDEAVVRFAVVDGQTFGARVVGVDDSPEHVARVPLVTYPNPTSGRVTVEAGLLGRSPRRGSRVVVFDTAGRLVHSAALSSDGSANLDLSGVPPGVYLLRVGTQIGRVVVH